MFEKGENHEELALLPTYLGKGNESSMLFHSNESPPMGILLSSPPNSRRETNSLTYRKPREEKGSSEVKAAFWWGEGDGSSQGGWKWGFLGRIVWSGDFEGEGGNIWLGLVVARFFVFSFFRLGLWVVSVICVFICCGLVRCMCSPPPLYFCQSRGVRSWLWCICLNFSKSVSLLWHCSNTYIWLLNLCFPCLPYTSYLHYIPSPSFKISSKTAISYPWVFAKTQNEAFPWRLLRCRDGSRRGADGYLL